MEDDLRFPIGEFMRSKEISPETRKNHMRVIAELPARLQEAIGSFSEEQLDTPYRPGGWTVRQTIHHIADSHANSLIRFKLALTEDDTPTIRPYYEDRWAELSDSKLPIEASMKMIDGIHVRWTALLKNMSDNDFDKTFMHPETGEWRLDDALAMYAWHSKHHTAHITNLCERKGWDA